MTLPNLIYVGADKAGSSWYFEMLRRHPDIFVTESKDLFFFDRFFSRGMEWYESKFSKALPDQPYVCELSHDYLYSQEAIDRIAQHLPGVQLLVSVRRPLDRLLSEYRYLQRRGVVPSDMSVDATIQEYEVAMVDRGIYAPKIQHCVDRLGADRVHVFDFGELEASPHRLRACVLERLGLDPSLGEEVTERVNSARLPRRMTPARLVGAASSRLRAAGHDRLIGKLKQSDLVVRMLFAEDRRESASLGVQLAPELMGRFERDAHDLTELTGHDYVQAWYG